MAVIFGIFQVIQEPAESHSKVVPYLIKSADKEFKARWMRANHDMNKFDGPGSLDKFYAEIKRMSGITPVDELFVSFTFYMSSFRQGQQ